MQEQQAGQTGSGPIAEAERPIAEIAPKERSYNPKKEQEGTRSLLAKILVGLFSATSLFILVGIFLTDMEKKDKTKDFATIILTSQGTLVGTALGFYFGDRS